MNIQKKIATALAATLVTVCFTGCSEDAMNGKGSYYSGSTYSEAYVTTEIVDGAETESCIDPASESTAESQEDLSKYDTIVENGFVSPTLAPLSTFSIDVDTACYAYVRRMLQEGAELPSDAIRIEELLNYFHYNYTMPDSGEVLAATTELMDCPWNAETKLMLVGLQAETLTEVCGSNYVFLIDVSGSMSADNKLALVKQSFEILTAQLTAADTVSIVTYSGMEKVVLSGVPGNQTDTIMDAVNALYANGSTAGSAGIQSAYAEAEQYFIEGGNNRVIMATDGDLNVGITDQEQLKTFIEEKRESGIFLSVLGFGSGNYSDALLETVADYGNGNYNYIDSLDEARRVLQEDLSGTLYTVAKDVKIQVEFNPAEVSGYRLIGYENRALSATDFTDDTKDAGEIGSGQQVTALYEVALVGSEQDVSGVVLEYQNTTGTESDNFATLHLSYKLPDAETSTERAIPIAQACLTETPSDALRFAAAVTEFGLILRGSAYLGSSSYENVFALLSDVSDVVTDEYKYEFESLVGLAEEQGRGSAA